MKWHEHLGLTSDLIGIGTLVFPLMTSAALMLWSRLQGQSGPWIALCGLGAFGLALLAVNQLRSALAHPGQRQLHAGMPPSATDAGIKATIIEPKPEQLFALDEVSPGKWEVKVRLLFDCPLQPDRSIAVVKEWPPRWFPVSDAVFRRENGKWLVELTFGTEGKPTIHVVKARGAGLALIEFFTEVEAAIGASNAEPKPFRHPKNPIPEEIESLGQVTINLLKRPSILGAHGRA